MTTPLLQTMMAAALEAAEIVMDVYRTDFDTIEKSDGSPVTLADQRAEEAIIAAFADTGIPVLGEESVAAGRIADLGARYFVVDPLDGTKEFIKRNGEFTVNIALVENGVPTLGVVVAPALGQAFSGGPEGAREYELTDGVPDKGHPIAVSHDGPMRVVASRSHGHKALGPLCDAFEVIEDVSVGSSLKFCLVARGQARLYPRFTPTCEWDIAAGQAVLQAAGGALVALDGHPMTYGKRDRDFLNPFFVAADSLELARAAATKMRTLLGQT